MKQLITLVSILIFSFILISCSAGRYPYPGPDTDLGRETWRSKVDKDPNQWAMRADQWFLAGSDSRAAIENRKASIHQAISRVSVRVSNFHSIKANGDFQIQIVGDPDGNSVTIDGPNQAVRAVVVKVSRNMLCLDQIKDAPPGMNRVIIHIRVKDLRCLEHHGNGRVEGIRLFTDNLKIESFGCGPIFLAGHMDVKKIISRGTGSINVFTVNAYGTEIETYDSGTVNLSARRAVWLRSIKHQGSGDVNVIGASSQGLVVNTEGKGKIGVYGLVNVKEIKASGETCVFIENAISDSICIYVYDDAHVGIAGRASSFKGNSTRHSRLMARDFMSSNTFVEASGQSHMNVNATNKIFATANDYATIYYYGNPNLLTEFENQNGSVINMGKPQSPDEVIVSTKKPHHRHTSHCGCGRRSVSERYPVYEERYPVYERYPVSGRGTIKMGAAGQAGSAHKVMRKSQPAQSVGDHIYV